MPATSDSFSLRDMMEGTMGAEMLRGLRFDDCESIKLVELELSCWFVFWRW